ncbi:MAG: gliding motility-associated C-terminal domain-containing protein [Flavobacteriales bacterium]|nr:gliding motility-associated C-terminal domain-containing protein [Flavobacteriales bacterium]
MVPLKLKRTLTRLAAAMALAGAAPASAQVFPFTSGPIPMCDTSTFTASVSGVGWLITPNGWNWGPYLDNVVLNITSNHPHTLQISLTSPGGTTLLLSAFNGAGGQNYTNTNFPFWGGANITTASAPFTGSFSPQGGSLDVFSGQNADGIWTITVIDTACAGGGTGPGGPWMPGWFNGGVGSGGFAFGFSSPPPPCWIDMGSYSATICAGETVDVLSGFESNWWWDASATVYVYLDWSGTVVPDPYAVSVSGTYYIEVDDWWNNCTYSGNFTVNVAQGIALGPDQVVEQCSGAGPVDLAAVFNTAGATSFSWTLDGAPIASATAAAATVPGLYEVTASNIGCSDMAQVTLSFLSDPVLGPDQAVSICQGSSADLASLFDTSGLSADWSFGGSAIAPPVAATQAGLYTITVTTPEGCTDNAEVTLDVQAPPALGADQSIGLCSGTSADIAALFATTGLGTSWTLNGAAVPDPGAIIAGGDYELVATDAVGCSDTAVVSVTLWSSPSLGADGAATICAGDAADLTALYNSAGLTAAWTLGGVAVADPAAVSAAGTYTLTVTDANGCSDAAEVVVSVAANPVLGPDQQMSICDGTSVNLTTLYATGGASASWSLSGVPIADPSAVGNSGAYTLTVTNASGCTASAVVTVSVDPSPALGGDQAPAICEGSSFDLTVLYATAGLAEEWTINGGAVTDPSAAAVAGSYRLVVTNATGCTDTAWVSLAVNANPALGDDQFFTLCPWQTVDLSAAFPTVGLSASYTFDGTPLADPTAVSDSGTYVISVSDANGCSDEALAFIVDVECLCIADFETEARCLQDPARFTLLADSVIISAHWDFGGAADASIAIDPEVRFDAEEEVRVTLEATLTCGVVIVERVIPIIDCSDSCSVWIPNAFTPDKDDRNDAWTWRGECEPQDFSMAIFNRWGEVVFETTDPSDAWDGSYRGGPAPDGVYAYRVGYRLPYQKARKVAGSLTLLR